MAYVKTTWVAGVTILSAVNMNHLEEQYDDAIADSLQKTVFDAHSVVIAIANDTPVVLPLAASQMIGRKAAGNILALAKADVLTIINVTEGADVTGNNAPQAHDASHENAGGDEISVADLSGLLADDQHVIDAEVLAVAISKTLMTTRGDIIFRNATVPARLAKGNLNDVFTMGANDPAWSAPSQMWTLAETLSPSSVNTITSSTFTAADAWMIIVDVVRSGSSGGSLMRMRVNGDSGNNYGSIRATTTHFQHEVNGNGLYLADGNDNIFVV